MTGVQTCALPICWLPELTEDLHPAENLFIGKPDIYHAFQACLIPLFPAEGSLTAMIVEENKA